MKTGPVIVGYDKTPQSDRAVAVAAREAEARGASLTLVHAWHWTPPVTPAATPGADTEAAFRESADALIEQVAAGVRARHPGLPVSGQSVAGYAPAVLAAAAREAALLVVGNRGSGGFTGQILGSVALRVLAQACCPVIVVRGESRPTQDEVLVLLDIDEPCDELVDFAFATAERHGARLTALHVWDEPWAREYAASPASALDRQVVLGDRQARLDAVIRVWNSKYPEVVVAQRVETGSAGRVAVEASARADLVIAGARRHSDGQHGMRVGPVANTVLHHAACPVAVFPLD
jgi:nucleotide-binding universal stress UspA family protein